MAKNVDGYLACETCDHKAHDGEGHCYMFREKPRGNSCAQWRPSLMIRDGQMWCDNPACNYMALPPVCTKCGTSKKPPAPSADGKGE